MAIYSLTNHVYTSWGPQYQYMNWDPRWNIFINLADNEVKTLPFGILKPIQHVITWFDRNILQRIQDDKKSVLDVRIRIVCGLINKIPSNKLSREMKIDFMECIWDAYKKFYANYIDWHCKWILKLPFLIIGL